MSWHHESYMKNLSLLSLNCFDISLLGIFSRKLRLKRLAKEIIRRSPDVVCLQEINFVDSTGLYQALFRSAGYHVIPEKVSFNILNPGGLFTASKLPVESSEFIKYTNQGSTGISDIVERIIIKGYHKIVIKPGKAPPITVINTHLHYPMGEFYTSEVPPLTSAEYEQIYLNENLSKRTIFTGDMNILPSNKLYLQICKTMHDPLAQSKTYTVSPKNTHRKLLSHNKGRIDYSFISKDLATHASQRVTLNRPVHLEGNETGHLSDHYGIWTELSL